MISKNLKIRMYTSLVLLSLVILIFNFNLILVYSLIILGVISILEFLEMIKQIPNLKYSKIFYSFFFILYIFLFCLAFFLFSNLHGLKVIIYTLLFGCIASDIGGFIFGKTFKGPKLTKISPNKTFSGALGSIIFSTTVVSSLFFYFIDNFSFTILIIGVVTSVFCQIGDLLFSYLKRKANLKDTGNFLPGHGGVLDRLDGIFLGIPFGFLSLIILY